MGETGLGCQDLALAARSICHHAKHFQSLYVSFHLLLILTPTMAYFDPRLCVSVPLQ